MKLQLMDDVMVASTAAVPLRADADIRHDVVEQVLRRVLVAENGMIRVEATNGIVTLTGLLDQLSAVNLTVRLSRQVTGVVDVVDHLGYERDDL
jgi:osmotically-inducible protein OsmY